MIAYIPLHLRISPRGSPEQQIMEKYKIGHAAASFLSLIPSSHGDWEGYEEAKEFLGDLGLPTTEYENAVECLMDRMGI